MFVLIYKVVGAVRDLALVQLLDASESGMHARHLVEGLRDTGHPFVPVEQVAESNFESLIAVPFLLVPPLDPHPALDILDLLLCLGYQSLRS